MILRFFLSYFTAILYSFQQDGILPAYRQHGVAGQHELGFSDLHNGIPSDDVGFVNAGEK